MASRTPKKKTATKSTKSPKAKTTTRSSTTRASTTGSKALKSATRKTTRPKASGSKSPVTKVVVRYDVGWDNEVYVRGSGANLSWNKGTKLKNLGNDTWVWETRSKFTDGEFKVLINDTIFEEGGNRPLKPGASLEVMPEFVW